MNIEVQVLRQGACNTWIFSAAAFTDIPNPSPETAKSIICAQIEDRALHAEVSLPRCWVLCEFGARLLVGFWAPDVLVVFWATPLLVMFWATPVLVVTWVPPVLVFGTLVLTFGMLLVAGTGATATAGGGGAGATARAGGGAGATAGTGSTLPVLLWSRYGRMASLMGM